MYRSVKLTMPVCSECSVSLKPEDKHRKCVIHRSCSRNKPCSLDVNSPSEYWDKVEKSIAEVSGGDPPKRASKRKCSLSTAKPDKPPDSKKCTEKAKKPTKNAPKNKSTSSQDVDNTEDQVSKKTIKAQVV